MALKKHKNANENLKFYKRFLNKMNIFSFYLLKYNKVSVRVYAFLIVFFDYVFQLMLPAQVILNIGSGNDQQKFMPLNFITLLGQSNVFQYVTYVINGLLVIFLAIVIFYFLPIKNNAMEMRLTSSGPFTFLAFLIILIGRFLFQYIFAIQLVAVKCTFFTTDCLSKTQIPSLITNIIGLILSAIFFQMKQSLLVSGFPDVNVPQSRPSGKFQYVTMLQKFVIIGLIVFQNDILAKSNFYVLMIPIVVIQTAQLWIILFNRVSFSQLIDIIIVTKDSFLWTLSFFAMVLDLSSTPSDISFLILVIITVAVISAVITLQKQSNFNRDILKSTTSSETNAEAIIHTILFYTQSQDDYEDLQLRHLFLKHTWDCEDKFCLCQVKKDEASGLEAQKLHLENKSKGYNLEELAAAENVENEEIQSSRGLSGIKDKGKRNQIILLLSLKNFRKQFDSKQLAYLEIFIKSRYMNQVYSSFYDMLKLKRQSRSGTDKQIYQFLKITIMQKTKELEKESKYEIFDIDKALEIDYKYQKYKKLILESSILVESFWVNLSKKDYMIAELMEIGNKIVENYLDVKYLYESIILDKPDHKEVVLINIHFNQDVMNFELEALQSLKLFKNIEQKLKITRQNQYFLSKESLGLVLVSCSPTIRNKILLTNKNLCKLLYYNESQLVGRDINLIIPKHISNSHDQLMERYMQQDHSRSLHSVLQRVWAKKADGTIMPVQITLQTCISEDQGLIIVAFFNPFEEVIISNINCKPGKVHILLTDENGNISNVSYDFKTKYMVHQSIVNEESKYNLENIFTDLSLYSAEDLIAGVKTTMVSNFAQLENDNGSKMKKNIEVVLSLNEYQLLGGQIFKEIIFFETGIIQENREDYTLGSKYEIEDISLRLDSNGDNQLDQMNRDSFDQNEVTHSSVSASSNSGDILLNKSVIDLKQIPQSLQNLRRAIFIFFLILICTTCVVLIVSVISYNEFSTNTLSVKNSIFLVSSLANMRLSFNALINDASVLPAVKDNSTFVYDQGQLYQFYDVLQDEQTYMTNDQFKAGTSLSNLLNKNMLQLTEIQSDLSLHIFNTTFQIGVSQFIAKIYQFVPMAFTYLQGQVASFMNSSSTAQLARDYQYIIKNGNGAVRDMSLAVSSGFVQDAQASEQTYKSTVLIISMCCIVITVLASCILIPVTFSLDTEQEEIVRKWMLISESSKKAVIVNINKFATFLQNEESSQKIYHDDLSQQNPYDDVSLDNSTIKVNLGNKQITAGSRLSQFDIDNNNGILFKNSYQGRREEIAGEQILDESVGEDRSFQLFVKKSDHPNQDIHRQNSPQHKRQSDNFSPLQDFQTGSFDKNNGANNYMTTIDKGTVLQALETQDDMMRSEAQLDHQTAQLKSIYFIKKIRKIALILTFSLIIIAFYILSYFLSSQMFTYSAQNFGYMQVINQREPCLAESLVYLMESFVQNKSQTDNYGQTSAFDYSQIYCMNIESQYNSYITAPPAQLSGVLDVMKDINTGNACNVVFSDNSALNQACLLQSNGIMTNGLRNTINSFYYHIISEFTIFTSAPPANRTKAFLTLHQFDTTTKAYTNLLLKYMTPTFAYLDGIISNALTNFLSKQIQIFVIVFVVFILFLVVSLFFSLRFLIEQLKKDVFRSRILVKIIPVNELQKISKLHLIEKNRLRKARQQQFNPPSQYLQEQ